MSGPEILVRLLLGAVFILIGIAVLLPVLSERHGHLAAVLVLAAGTTVVLIGVGHVRGGRRG